MPLTHTPSAETPSENQAPGLGRRSLRWRVLAALAVFAVVAAGCSGETQETTTTTAPPVEETTTTTVETPTEAEGFGAIPAATGDCATDLGNVEEIIDEMALEEIDEEEERDAFGDLLRATTSVCRTDVMDRWSKEVYQPWIRGESVEVGVVPLDIREWPEEWRENRPSGPGGGSGEAEETDETTTTTEGEPESGGDETTTTTEDGDSTDTGS